MVHALLLRVLARASRSGPQPARSAAVVGATGRLHVVLLSILVAFISTRCGFYKLVNKRCIGTICCGIAVLQVLQQAHSSFRCSNVAFDILQDRACLYPVAITITTRVHSPICLPDNNHSCSLAITSIVCNPCTRARADTWYDWQLEYDAAIPLFKLNSDWETSAWRFDLGAAALALVGVARGTWPIHIGARFASL